MLRAIGVSVPLEVKFSHCALDGTLYLLPRRDSRVVPWTGRSHCSQDGTLHLFPRRDSRIVPRTGLSYCSQCGTLSRSQLRRYEEGITGISGTKEDTSFSLWSLAQGRSPKLIACLICLAGSAYRCRFFACKSLRLLTLAHLEGVSDRELFLHSHFIRSHC